MSRAGSIYRPIVDKLDFESQWYWFQKYFAMQLHFTGAAKDVALRTYQSLLSLRYPFRGTYRTFAEAVGAAGTGKQVGYDHSDMAGLYVYRLGKLNASDYASMWWLSQIIAANPLVGDFGGNVGLEYYAFSRYLAFPAALRWLICDVPAVVECGRKIAAERQVSHVNFTTNFADLDGSDILHSSGTLQYVEDDIAGLIQPLARKPRHIILNRIPIHDREEFVTLQRIRGTLCPYRVFERGPFVESIEALGYELVDTWPCAEITMRLLFHSEKELTSYSGFYLRLKRPDDQSN